MKRFLVLFALLCSWPLVVQAKWALVPMEDLVAHSDLIVVGTLRGVAEHSRAGVDYGQGIIEVHEVIWGPAKPGDSLTLKWQNLSDITCPRVEHRGNADEKGLWLLTKNETGPVKADYLGRFVALSERPQLEKILQNGLFLTGGSFMANEPLIVTVIYRNFSDAEKRFPALAARNGRLYLSPGSKLKVWNFAENGSGKRYFQPFSGRLLTDSQLASVVVPPYGEMKVTFDLKKLLAVPKEYDSRYINLTLGRLKAANEANIVVINEVPQVVIAPSEIPLHEAPSKLPQAQTQKLSVVPDRFSRMGLLRALSVLIVLLFLFRRYYLVK